MKNAPTVATLARAWNAPSHRLVTVATGRNEHSHRLATVATQDDRHRLATVATQDDRHRLATVATSDNGETGQSLPNTDVKLDKVCRLYRKQRRGAAVVEFAIVAPLFFLMVFGMIEYGRMVMVQQVITNASREGARRAVLDGADAGEVEEKVKEFLRGSSINDDAATVNTVPDPSTAPYGTAITVTVSIDFEDVSWMPSPMYLGGQEMRASTAMRRESVQ